MKARESVYATIQYLDADTIRLIYNEDEEELEPFINVVRWFLKNQTETLKN